MKIEVYDSKDNLVREIECGGPEASYEWDHKDPFDSAGKCNGCNDEQNLENIECYKKGARIWFVDPATLAVNNDWSLDDFTIKTKQLRTNAVGR